ncbi:MAG: hypothetical protein NTZ49_05965 [Candidatus Parcubacteria bacterium]|nr:hypothetical protein [Candidatus Parcubacteria bacterium]
MKKIIFKTLLVAALLLAISPIFSNICQASQPELNLNLNANDLRNLNLGEFENLNSDYIPIGQSDVRSTVARIISAILSLLGILCFLGIFVCVPLGIYFLTKKELVSGTPGEKPLVDIGEILKKGWNLFKNNYQQFVNPLLILAGSYLVFMLVLGVMPYAETYGIPMLLVILGFLLFALAYIFISLWITIVIIKIIANLYLSQPVEMRKIYEESFSKVPSYLWANILNFLVVFAGLILFVIPGIIFSIWFTFAPYVNILADTDNKGVASLKSSYYLTKGRWLDVFIRLFVCGLVVGLASLALVLILVIPYGIITFMVGENLILSIVYNILMSILSLILTPLSLAFVVILYYSLVETRPSNNKFQPTAPTQI